MPSFYVHLSGRDIDDKMLQLHGLKLEKQEQLKDIVRICERCQANNAPVSKFCARCGLALDLRVAIETDTRIAKAEEVLEALLSNASVKDFLVEKIRALGLAEKSG